MAIIIVQLAITYYRFADDSRRVETGSHFT